MSEHLDGRRQRWTEHRASRRSLLVDAGVAAVDRHGADTSAEQVAASAQVSRTVLYRYFRDKDDLRAAVAGRIGEIVVGELQTPLRSGATANEIIAGTLSALTEWVEAHPRLYEFLRRRGSAIDDIEATIAAQLAALLSEVVAAFGPPVALTEATAQSLVGMVEHTLEWWMNSHALSQTELVEHLRNAIADVLAGELRRANIPLGLDDPLPAAVAVHA